jgi:hypothetical protein
MAVNVVEVDTRFYSEVVNGTDLDDNLASYTDTFSDSVTGRCKAVTTIEVSVGMNISNFQILYADSADQADDNPLYKIVKDDAAFLNEGFTKGSSIALTFDPGLVSGTVLNCYLIVTSVTNKELLVTYNGQGADDNNDISLSELHSRVNSQASIDNPNIYDNPGYIAIDPSFTALEYSYNLIENSAGNASLVSPLTGTTNVIKVKDIPVITGESAVSGNSTARNKAAVMGGVTVELLDKVYNNNALLQLKFGNRYEITHEFTVPYYFDGEDENVKDTTTPPDLYNGTSATKYIYQTTWFTDINDPNTGSTNTYSSSKGNGGYFDEAFNGDENPYEVIDLVYFDVDEGVVTDRLSIGKRIRVNFDITNSLNDFSPTQIGVMVHGAIVDSTDYSSSKDVFDTVWTFETARTNVGVAPSTNVLIQDYEITYNNSGSISVQYFNEFTTPQNLVLEENQFYILAFQVRKDSEPQVLKSHKVHLLVDYNQYGKNNDVEGLFDFETFTQHPHPLPIEEEGFTNALTFNECGMTAKGRFWVLNSANLNALKFDIVVYNFTNDTWDSMRTLAIDLSEQTTVNGIQQIELDTTRGYILKDGNIFNFLKLTTDNNDGTKQYYEVQVGYRIPWQSWNELASAPAIFYDKTKDNNGLNQKSSNYSMVATGLNTFTDGDGGTFEDNNAAGWGFSILNTPPQEVGSTFFSANIARTGSFGCAIQSGASSMDEASKVYAILKNNNGVNVVDGTSYTVSCYMSLRTANVDPTQIDNGSFYFLPDGYDVTEMRLIKPFEIVPENLHEDVDPLFSDWHLFETTFRAKTTGLVTFTLYEELKTDIPGGTGCNFFIDDLTVKAVEYGIKVLFDATVDQTNYVKPSEEISVYDYHTDDQQPTAFTCENITFKLDPDDPNSLIQIENNLIESGYTQYQAIHKPIVPPIFTSSVDMTEVSGNPPSPESWKRFAHGNLYTQQDGFDTRRLGVWANDQANDNDTFRNTDNSISRNKLALDLYTSDPIQILADQNLGAFYGCYSLVQYEFYQITGKMFSASGDNDGILYQIAFIVDEVTGVEHTLSLVATTGGVAKNTTYVSGDPASDRWLYTGIPNNGDECNWSLVYDYGKGNEPDSYTIIDQFFTGETGFGWGSAQVGDLDFDVKRSGDEIVIVVDWLINGTPYNSTFNYNLNDNVFTKQFKGYSNIGFGFHSQNLGGFQAILTRPEGDFYIEMRIDAAGSLSDKSNSRISSLLEAPDNNLLGQITGDLVKATLSYDGINEQFVGQCLVETSQIKAGQNYDLSSVLRPRNLEV